MPVSIEFEKDKIKVHADLRKKGMAKSTIVGLIYLSLALIWACTMEDVANKTVLFLVALPVFLMFEIYIILIFKETNK